MEKQSNSSLEIQVGGAHYKDMKMQPIELIAQLNLDFFHGNFVKYISRYKNKNGKQDLEKCLHYIQLREELIGNPLNGITFRRLSEKVDVRESVAEYCNINDLSPRIYGAISYFLVERYDLAKEIVQRIIKEEYGTEQ